MTTVRQIGRALAADEKFSWNFLIENCIVCRSLDGLCLRGVLVDRTSSPGLYRLYAFTQSWFWLVQGVRLSFSFQLSHHLFGDHTQVAEQAAPFLLGDEEVRRVVFAHPDEPTFVSAKTTYAQQFAGPHSRAVQFDLLLMRAWDRQVDGLAAELRQFHQMLDRSRPNQPQWDRYRRAVTELAACLDAGSDPRTVIEPWNQAVRDKLRIQPVARMRFRSPTA